MSTTSTAWPQAAHVKALAALTIGTIFAVASWNTLSVPQSFDGRRLSAELPVILSTHNSLFLVFGVLMSLIVII
jgi:hypothetical protein